MDKNFLDYEGLTDYDSRIKNHITAEITTKHANDATVQDVAALEEPDESDIDDLAETVATKVAQAFFNATEETVLLTVTTSVNNVTLQGKEINVFYNGSNTLGGQYVLDANGMCLFKVPNGYTYRIVFPDITGCITPSNVLHTAAILLRSVEVEYIGESQEEELKGRITVNIRDFANHTYSNVSDITITASYNGTSVQATTNSSGNADFYIPYGATYTITIPNREERYILYNKNTKTGTVLKGHEVLRFVYYVYDVGIFIVTEDGDLYNFEEWQNLVEVELTKQNSEALYLRVVTDNLVRNGATFVVSIDTLRNKDIGSGISWQNSSVLIPTSVTPNGYISSSSTLYYDGYTASQVIYQWATDEGYLVPAITKCLNLSVTIDNIPRLGFLGSAGLWLAISSNENTTLINSILAYTRPEGSYNLSSIDSTKRWLCHLYNASSANIFLNGTINSSSVKTSTNGIYAIPFYAY